MKSLIFAYVMLIILLAAVILNSIMVSNSIKNILDKLNSISNESACTEDYETLFKDYMKKQKFISLSVNHSYLTDVEGDFAEIITAARENETSELMITKSRLMSSLSHIRRLASINIDSIF